MEHDHLFKELLTTFFGDFVDVLLPDVAEYMEPDGIEFLDKEIFTDIASSERHEVDLLVKVRFRGHGECCFLIHVENQAYPQADFAKRMFLSFARIDAKYNLPIFPVAIFSYDYPLRPEPNRHRVKFPGQLVLDFAFRSIQLNQLNWRDYLRTRNPVATALMTKMHIAPEDRPRVKLECLRMLATLKLDKARSTLISAFMENYLKLTAAETAVYNRELEEIEPQEREVVMYLTNEWIEKGKAEGLSQGRREILLRQLRRRLKEIPTEFTDQIRQLPDFRLDELADAVLDFANLADAKSWFAEHSGV